MTTMREFVRDAGIKIDWEETSRNPNMISDEAWSRGARHYKVVLSRGGRRMTTYFSKGSALEYGVEAHEVVNALATDATSVLNSSGWKDWARDMGFEWEPTVEEIRSRDRAEDYGYEKDWDTMQRVKKTYALIERQTEALRRVLGPEVARPLLRGEIEFD